MESCWPEDYEDMIEELFSRSSSVMPGNGVERRMVILESLYDNNPLLFGSIVTQCLMVAQGEGNIYPNIDDFANILQIARTCGFESVVMSFRRGKGECAHA